MVVAFAVLNMESVCLMVLFLIKRGEACGFSPMDEITNYVNYPQTKDLWALDVE